MNMAEIAPTTTVYDRYMSTGFAQVHDLSRDEYRQYERYYRRNYGPHLPDDPKAPILDVGCGPGHFLHYLKQRGCENYLGIDQSPECVDACRAVGLPAHRADAFDYLVTAPGAFAAVTCSDLLEHLEPDRGVDLLKRCRRALSPDGVLLVKVPNMACPVAPCRTRYVDLTHAAGYTDHSLRTALQVAGFDRVTIHEVDVYVTSNPLANLAGRLGYRISCGAFRLLELLYGVRQPHLMSKSILAVATK